MLTGNFRGIKTTVQNMTVENRGNFASDKIFCFIISSEGIY
ncbi:MAG: hypothetical protein GQF41_1856 [Candidatus Rifleibacterium amylolyticum]|nr:MAG: hypothetical protein GQF41_1856 [Candidatus Rifleibacterium amylolyticum]